MENKYYISFSHSMIDSQMDIKYILIKMDCMCKYLDKFGRKQGAKSSLKIILTIVGKGRRVEGVSFL